MFERPIWFTKVLKNDSMDILNHKPYGFAQSCYHSMHCLDISALRTLQTLFGENFHNFGSSISRKIKL